MTRLFAIEYNQHFLVSLPTYFSLSNAILLGGTSNFFRIETLKSLGGWDPKNVTEDADLGIKMARKNYRVVPMDIMTYEEAPPKVYPWLKQRIRWNKGYLYTLLIHFRHPLKILKEIGLKSFLLTFHQLLSPIISALSLPGGILFALYWLNWFGMPLEPISKWIMTIYDSSPLLFYSSLLTLGFGPIYSILMSLEGLFRQEDDYTLSKVKYVPLFLMYLVLQSVSSIIAIIELIGRPYLWHKTPHGFSIENKELYQLGST
jgi:cellulose synthase/poly-beta-1,6-N-acetylglucosamine synthase-like glycosyltransferase